MSGVGFRFTFQKTNNHAHKHFAVGTNHLGINRIRRTSVRNSLGVGHFGSEFRSDATDRY